MPLPYSRSGEENLRANPSVKYNAGKDHPNMKGEDVGGTSSPRVTQVTKRAAFNDTPAGSQKAKPAGVQNFDGMAKEGGR